jgi:hypothetical protein
LRELKFCNLEIIEYFKKFQKSDAEYFILTISDVDNLGYLVAENGRAIAQNFVDYVINVIGNSINIFCVTNKSLNFVYSPSGEEVSIFMYGKSLNQLKDFNNHLNKKVNSIIAENKIVGFNQMSVSFGSHIFKRKEIIKKIDYFLNLLKSEDKLIVEKGYYKLLYELRKKVEKKIDQEKFRNIYNKNSKHVVALRNFVYFKTIANKESISNLLPKYYSQILKEDPSVADELCNSFGIDGTKRSLIEKAILKLNNNT